MAVESFAGEAVARQFVAPGVVAHLVSLAVGRPTSFGRAHVRGHKGLHHVQMALFAERCSVPDGARSRTKRAHVLLFQAGGTERRDQGDRMTMMTPAQVADALDDLESSDGPLLQRRRRGPRWMVVHGAVLLVLLAFLTVVAAFAAESRARALQQVTRQDTVLAEELQAAYTSLTQADNAVTTAFLLGPQSSPLRDGLDAEFLRAVAVARAKIDSAVLGTGGDPRAVRASAELSAYRGQVEAARALRGVNSAAAPVALRSATATMRADLLPLVDGRESLLADVRARSARAVVAATGFPWWTVGLGVLALLALVNTQRRLAARLRRRLSAGLLLAVVAVAVTTAVSVEVVRALRVNASLAAEATATADQCARIANGARRAHSAETLWTVRLASDPTVLETVRRELAGLRGNTGVATTDCGPVDASVALWERSLADRANVLASSTDGFAAAVQVVAGEVPGSSGAAYRRLVTDSDAALITARQRVEQSLNDAAAGASRLLPVTVALGALAVVGVVVGLWPRIREYP